METVVELDQQVNEVPSRSPIQSHFGSLSTEKLHAGVDLIGIAALITALIHFSPEIIHDFQGCWWRLGCGGMVVSAALVLLAVPQAVKLSGGVLPAPSFHSLIAILAIALPTQTLFKTVQYFSLRTIKRSLDRLIPGFGVLNTIGSYGITATIMQSAAYNHAISTTYHHHGVSQLIFQKYDTGNSGTIDTSELRVALLDAKVSDIDAAAALEEHDADFSGSLNLEEFTNLVEACEARRRARVVPLSTKLGHFIQSNVIPGFFFSFLRECGATGAGIVLGPFVRKAMEPIIGGIPVLLAKIISGILAGMFTSLMTQWLHNNALRAGTMAQMGALPSTPAVLLQTWNELGFRMFYLNAERRVLSTATATATLGVVDIFA